LTTGRVFKIEFVQVEQQAEQQTKAPIVTFLDVALLCRRRARSPASNNIGQPSKRHCLRDLPVRRANASTVIPQTATEVEMLAAEQPGVREDIYCLEIVQCVGNKRPIKA